MKRRRVTRPTAAEREVLDLVLGEMRLARRKHEQLELLIDAWLTSDGFDVNVHRGHPVDTYRCDGASARKRPVKKDGS